MTDDKIDSLRKRVTERREAASRRLKETISGKKPPPERAAIRDQATLQAAGAAFSEHAETDPIGAGATYGFGNETVAERPAAPVGRWRCIVHSSVVSIDLVASIVQDGSLSGQGSIIYVGTNRLFNVSGQGDWTALPPDSSSTNWLFKFRLQPANHAIFSWFAAPTSSPNHLYNRFVVPDNGSVVETNCERIG